MEPGRSEEGKRCLDHPVTEPPVCRERKLEYEPDGGMLMFSGSEDLLSPSPL